MIDRIYVAATSQHVGKTTTTLGLVAALGRRGLNVGYCKPVGQEFVDLGDLKVDKDALLFAKTMEFTLSAERHSPVIVGRGVTTSYLDDPGQFDFRQRIETAARELQAEYDFVVYEGTGHPGVGTVIKLSNAQVAKMLNAPVVMVAEGGIGNTIDRLNTNLALFREQEVPILGVILNKVIPNKIEKVTHYVGKQLAAWNIPLLGVLPYDRSLSNPIMESVRHAVNGQVVFNGHKLDNRVENIASGSLIEKKEFNDIHNLLLIVSHRRLDLAINSLQEIALRHHRHGTPLAGIIINGEGEFLSEFLSTFACRDYIDEHEIPIIATQFDTYGSAIKINQMEVKINTRTPWKTRRAIELVRDHVHLDQVL